MAIGCLGLAATSAAAQTNKQMLHAWLAAYNTGDPSAIRAFHSAYLHSSDIAFALDSREETGGFDLEKIESDKAQKLSALLDEHDFPARWRVTITREGSLPKLAYLPVPMSQPQAIAALDAFATKLSARDKFSGVVVIAQRGRTLLGKAWGLADQSRRIPVTLDTPFLFASQGKMFTAVAVLQLVAEGKVALDDPVGRYLTDYPNHEVAQKVTIRHLLTHQGGTGEIGILEPQDAHNRETVHSIADIIKLNEGRGPAFEPGSKWEYSNYGYVLLGAVIEKVSGQSYYDYVKADVFRPAEMTNTDYPLREGMSGTAVGYTKSDGDVLRESTDRLPWRGTPAGGGVSTASDMVRFVAALNAGKLIPLNLLGEATKKQTPWYGYGFISSDFKGFPYWGHGGGAPGNSLVLDYYPVTDTTFICMSNRDPPICDRLAFNYLFRSARASHPISAPHLRR
jgi:CubicO group peptidase (beta-lactamase class C family)